MGYWASRQDSTKQSPYYMLFQQQMQLPIDAELLPFNSDGSLDDVDRVVDVVLDSRVASYAAAKTSIETAQKKQKETYDRKHLPEELSIGTEVLLENTKQKQRKGNALDCNDNYMNYAYKIIKVESMTQYGKVHTSFIKAWERVCTNWKQRMEWY